MKKIFSLLGLFLLLGCENDDICDDSVVTPRLIVRVYDKDVPRRTKPIANLLIFGKDQNRALQPLATTDSLALPLRLSSGETSFILVKDAVVDSDGTLSAGTQMELKITATASQVFVNKGCGYKVVYDQLTASSEAVAGNTPWISRIQVMFRKVDDEKQASIRIFY